MQISHFSRFCSAALAALALAVPAASRAQSGYTLIDIAGPNFANPHVSSINNRGQVAGTFQLTSNHSVRACIYANGNLTVLSPQDADGSNGFVINDSGQVAGYGDLPGSIGIQVVLWTNGIPAELGTLGGSWIIIHGINNHGQVAGCDRLYGTSSTRAVLWTNGIPQDLGTLGGASGVAYGVNDSGQATGYAAINSTPAYYAFRYANGVMTRLDSLGGTKNCGDAINASGQVAGYSYFKGNSVFHAALWNGTAITDIGAFDGGNSEAMGINASGDVVGYSFDAQINVAAFLYTGGRMIDLNTLVPPGEDWQLQIASGINDNGWIVGQGHHNGVSTNFILKPNQGTAFGSLSLESIPNFNAVSGAVPLDTFHISFRQPGTLNEIYGADLSVTPLIGKSSAPFALSNIPPGHYDVAIKGAKSLRVVLPNITVGARISLPDVHLLTGDANGDNRVDSSDFALMIDAYGGVAGVAGSNYDPNVDFNLDGKIDSSDFGLLLGEFGAIGDL